MPKATKGLTPKTLKGLNKKNFERKGQGIRLILKAGDTVPVQFLQKPEDFVEYRIHSWQEDGRWEFVPCAGDNCPLCQDEDEKRSRTGYRFACNVFNLEAQKVQVMEGAGDLAGRIMLRYERKPNSFLKKVYEITRFPGSPVSFAVDLADEQPVVVKGLKLHDLTKFIEDEMRRYYGDDMPAETSAATSLEDDEDDDDEDLEDDEELEDEDDDLDEDDDEDDEDDDDDFDLDDEDEDDDEEDEEPAKPTRGRPKKAAAKKAKPATKAKRK